MRSPENTGANWVIRLLRAERARDLSQRLRLPVLIHELGWRSTAIEVEVTRRDDGSVVPARVLIGPAAVDLLMLDQEGVHGRFEHYNAVIAQLRDLARQLTELARRRALRPGSPIVYARAMLEPLDELIVRRERAAFGRGAVRLTALDHEIEVFTRYHACFAPIARHAAGVATSVSSRERDRRLESAS